MAIRFPSKFIRKTSMNTAELHIAQASVWATSLVCSLRRDGYRRDPYSRVAEMVGPDVPPSRIRSLVVRPRSLKTIASHVREGLAALYAKECERQKRLLEHERSVATAAGIDTALTRAAARLAGEDDAKAEETR